MLIFVLALAFVALVVGVRSRVSACGPRGRRRPAPFSMGGQNGRLDHLACVVRAGWFGCALVILMSLVMVWPAHAGAVYTHAQATSLCAQERDSNNAILESAGSPLRWKCQDSPGPAGTGSVTDVRCGPSGCDITGGSWDYQGDVPDDKCKSAASPSGTVWSGIYSDGSKMCANSCEYVFTQSPGTISIGLPDAGAGRSEGTFKPTGNTCTVGGSIPPQPSNDPPQLCSGGSCYDSSRKKFCAVNAAGVQTCVSGPTDPGGGAPPSQPSVCAVNGASAQCAHAAGDPPPTPPNPPITDPQKQQTGSGAFTGTTPGGVVTINTGSYQGSTGGGNSGGGNNGGGNGGGNGGTGGDGGGTGPGGDGDGETKCTAGQLCKDGYTDADCSSTPATAGDPLLSQLAVEAHRQRCRDQALAGEIGSADKGKGDDHDVSEVFKDADDSSHFDDSGFLGGGGACPGFPSVQYAGQEVLSSDGICKTAPILAGFVLFAAYVMAALVAARITSGARE